MKCIKVMLGQSRMFHLPNLHKEYKKNEAKEREDVHVDNNVTEGQKKRARSDDAWSRRESPLTRPIPTSLLIPPPPHRLRLGAMAHISLALYDSICLWLCVEFAPEV